MRSLGTVFTRQVLLFFDESSDVFLVLRGNKYNFKMNSYGSDSEEEFAGFPDGGDELDWLMKQPRQVKDKCIF